MGNLCGCELKKARPGIMGFSLWVLMRLIGFEDEEVGEEVWGRIGISL